MTDLDRVISKLRLSRGNRPACCNLEADVDDLLAALDAQKPIGFVSVQKDGSLRRYEDTKDLMFDEEYGGYFNAPVYLAPPAAAVPSDSAECDPEPHPEAVAWEYRAQDPNNRLWSEWEATANKNLVIALTSALWKAGIRAEWRSLGVLEVGGYAGECADSDFVDDY